MPQEIHPYSVLLRPLVTEKSTTLAGRTQYVFEVDLRANKTQVKGPATMDTGKHMTFKKHRLLILLISLIVFVYGSNHRTIR